MPTVLRVLVTTCPVLTHLWDVVPIAWALRSRGHDVRVASLPNLTPDVVRSSLTAITAGQELDATTLEDLTASNGMAGFARANAHMAALLVEGLLDEVKAFPPHVVVHEPADLAGPLIAQRLGVPCVHQSWGPPMRPKAREALHRAAAGLRRTFGMDETVAPPALVLDVCPPSYQDPGNRLAGPHQSMRYVPYNGPGAMPEWLYEEKDRPRVCVTVGTVVPERGGLPLVARIAQAIAADDLDIVVPLRPHHAAQLELRAPGVRVVDWLPLKLMTSGCDLAVHHGGPGTALTLLGAGVPQVTVPMFGAEFVNARLLEACGAGRTLDAGQVTDAGIAETVRSVLDDPAYRAAAGVVAAEIAAQPSPDEAAAAVEALVGGVADR